MKNILITGFNGFVGKHACAELKERGYKIHGVSHGGVDPESRDLVDKISLCDLSDPLQTAQLSIDGIDAVLNLAGFATNTGGDSELIHKINIGAHVNLYRRIAELGLSPRIIAVSSGAVYDPDQQMPETEDSTLKDAHTARDYEASKIRMEEALVPFVSNGADIVIARPFNHIGPGQGPRFLVPDLANKILEAKLGTKTFAPGNLDTMRDYTDVRDVVRAYADLVESPQLQYDLYNICSGVSRKGWEILRLLLTQMDPEGEIKVEGVDEGLLRENDPSNVFGAYARLHTSTGWEPKIPIEQTIDDFVKWRTSQLN